MSKPLRYPKPPELAQLGRGHGVVESSAGTGKTFLLEHLFVELILTHGLACEEILVVTFTEKATAELVLRLRALIARLAGLSADDPRAIEAADSPEGACWIIDDRAKQRLGEALLAFDRANIFTIHGFCRRVLGEHAFVQGRFFDEELIGEEAAFTDAFHEVLRAQAADGSSLAPPIAWWLSSGKSVENLEKLLRACDREKTTPMRVRFDEARLAAALAAWQPVAADDPALKARLKAAKVHHSSVKAILNRLARVSELAAECQGDCVRFLAGMQTVRDQYRKDGVLDYVSSKLPAADTGFAELSHAVRELDEATVPLEAFLAERLSPLVRERAASRKRKAGLFDFSDMVHLVARALADAGPAGSALVEALRGRYRHALIDEFQDTDEVQWSIFRRIFVQRTLVEGGGHHSLTVIGDPKQAIYGFRGADVQAYLGARKALRTAGANRVVLDRNFRSSAGIIDATNLIFDQGADFFRRDSGITYDQPVGCGRPDLGLLGDHQATAPVVVFALDSHGVPLRAPRARATVQAAIVNELRVLLDARSPFRLHSQGGDRALKARDIFILTFTNAESHAIGRALGAAAIPHAFYKLGNLFESPEAAEVLTVLRAIAEPEDRNLRALALLTGFFDLDVTGAAACLDLGHGARPIQQLLHFARLAQDGDIPTLFAALIDDSGIVRREVFAHASERTLTNITHVLEILQAEWAHSHAALPALADLLDGFIQGTRKPPSQEGDLQRLETDKDAVQILTVHKAKGLEADVVFLYGGTGEAARKEPVRVLHEDGKRVLHAGPLDDAGKRLVELETRDERSRLLYVALTRARYRLYLPHYPPEFTTLKGPYAQANQRLDTILGQGNELHPAHFSVQPCPADAIPAGASDAARSLWRTALLPMLLHTGLAPVREPDDVAAIKDGRSGFVVTSYTAVKHARGGYVASGSEPRMAGELALDHTNDSDVLPGGAETGIFLHDVLASVALADLAEGPSLEDWQALPATTWLLEKLGRRHARPASHLPLAARLVHQAYTTTVRLGDSAMTGLAAAKTALREVEFLFPIPERAHPLLSQPRTGAWTVERGVVKGFVDLLFEHDGRVFVCDWKSDTLPRFDPDTLARHCGENYDVQARIYTLATLRLCGITSAEDYARRFGGVLFSFLRGMGEGSGIHFFTPAWEDVLAWETDMLGQHFWGLAR